MDIKKLIRVTTAGTIVTTSVEQAFGKLSRMLRIVGLFPLDDQFQLVLRLAIPSAIVQLFLIFLSCTTVYFIYNVDKVIDMYSTPHHFIFYFRKFIETVINFVIVYRLCIKKKELLLVLENLMTVEALLAPLHEGWAWSLHPIKYLGNIVLLIVLFIFERSLYPCDLVITIHWSFVNIARILAAIFVNYFCALFDLMRYSLKRIKASDRYHLYPKLYCLIHDSCEILNDIFGVIMCPLVMVYFVGLHHQFYQFFGVSNKPFALSFDIICYGVYYSMLLLQIIFSCNAISSETKKFNDALYVDMVQFKLTEQPIYDDLIFHLERTKEFQLSANGFFTVNKSILCSMILLGTTYLVILMQYSERSPFKYSG